jgi:hypothetical protein
MTPDVPFILEYTNAETTAETNRRIRAYTAQARSNLGLPI